MNILVCMKQVFDDSVEVGYNEAAQAFTPAGIEKIENAFDTYALEMAARLKETTGGEITLLSIGDEDAKVALKNGLAVGGDEAVLILQNDFQDADSYSIAKLLAQGIQKLEQEKNIKFDLVFCGKETTDFACGQVGVMLAQILQTGVITDLVDVEYQDKITGKHETETGYEMIETSTPCVLTVSKPPYEPRYATIKSKMAARKKEIQVLSDLSLDTGKVLVKNTYERPKRQAGVKIVEKTPEEALAKAMALIGEAKVI